REGPFGPLLAEHMELFGGQSFSPLVIRQWKFFGHDRCSSGLLSVDCPASGIPLDLSILWTRSKEEPVERGEPDWLAAGERLGVSDSNGVTPEPRPVAD